MVSPPVAVGAVAVLVQCVTHTPALVQYLESGAHTAKCRAPDECVTCAFVKHLERVAAARRDSAIQPVSIVRRLPLIGRRLRLGRQEDAHEFMRLLLDSFHKSELRMMGLKESGPRSLVENTFVQHVFGGYFRNQLRYGATTQCADMQTLGGESCRCPRACGGPPVV